MNGFKDAGGVGLKGFAFAFAVPFANLLLTTEFFGSGFSRDRPITAFLSYSHNSSFFGRSANHS